MPDMDCQNKLTLHKNQDQHHYQYFGTDQLETSNNLLPFLDTYCITTHLKNKGDSQNEQFLLFIPLALSSRLVDTKLIKSYFDNR